MPDYVPGPVPLEQEDLAVYLQGELQRIANVLSNTVKHSYGGMLQTTGSVVVPLTPAFITLNIWDTVSPILSTPDGVEVDETTGELTVLTAGVYAIFFASTDNNLIVNAEYEFFAAIDGVQTPAGASIDPSNQTDGITVSIEGLAQIEKGKVITIEIASPTSDPWESAFSEFFMFRVSDTTD